MKEKAFAHSRNELAESYEGGKLAQLQVRFLTGEPPEV